MAFDTTNLSSNINELGKEISIKSVMDATTSIILKSAGSFQAGVKGKAKLLKLDNNIVIQSADACGRTPNGSTALSDMDIEVVAIKINENYCPKVLKNSFFAYAVTAGGSIEDEQLTSDFAKIITDNKVHDFSFEVEKLMWIGDKSISGASNYKHIDGFLKQATVGGTASYTDVSNDGDTVTAQLQNAFIAMPIAVRSKEDFRIFVGQDIYDLYMMEIANADYNNDVNSIKVLGTSATLIPTSGLNGTNKIMCVRLSNMQLAMDLEDEEEKAKFYPSIETAQLYFDIYSSIGVVLIRTNEVGVGTISL